MQTLWVTPLRCTLVSSRESECASGRQQGRADSKALLQQSKGVQTVKLCSSRVLRFLTGVCQLTQVDLYSGHKMAVFSLPPEGAWSIVISLSVCLSVRLHISQKPNVQTSWNFLCMLPVAMAQSFDDSAIRSGLWMMSYFYIIGHMWWGIQPGYVSLRETTQRRAELQRFSSTPLSIASCGLISMAINLTIHDRLWRRTVRCARRQSLLSSIASFTVDRFGRALLNDRWNDCSPKHMLSYWVW